MVYLFGGGEKYGDNKKLEKYESIKEKNITIIKE